MIYYSGHNRNWTLQNKNLNSLFQNSNKHILVNKLEYESHTIDARLLVENPFVEHDNSSNTTAGRKKRPNPTLGRFYFYLKYDTWSKKIDQVSDFAFFETSNKILKLPGIGHYKKSEWLTRLLAGRGFGLRFTVMYDGAIGLIVCSKRVNNRINR